MERWTGKVAIVTGASSGIGRSAAVELVKRGVKVVALARRKENLDALAEELKGNKGLIHAYKCDVTKRDDIKAAFDFAEKNVGPVSILINNAGVVDITPLNESKQEEALKIIETNVIGLINCTMEATTRMTKNNLEEGHIFNISSICGEHILPRKGVGAYTASKHAVTALSECLKNDLSLTEKSKIRVTNISPGVVETEMSQSFIETRPSLPRVYDKDVSDCIIFALQAPRHVNISAMTIQGVGEVFSDL